MEFEQFYQKYVNLVFSTCIKVLHNHEEAEDVSQEAWVKIYRSFRTIDTRNIPSWIATVAKHTAIDRLRQIHSPKGSTTYSTISLETLEQEVYTVDIEVNRVINNELILYSLANISQKHLTLFVLFTLLQFDYDEIASQTGMARSYVKQSVYYARNQARRGRNIYEKEGENYAA